MRIKLKPLSRQTIVITGGSSGIGLAIARRAVHRGARVVLVARDDDALKSVCHELTREQGHASGNNGSGVQADYVVADVGEREQLRHVVDTVVERYGGFDTWINDAGVGVYARLEEISDEDHARLFQTNYWGVVYGSTEALRHLRGRGGALINIGSISSDVPAPILSAYTASKHAVKGFTNSLRLELLHDDAPVSVTLIRPSGIHTPFGQHARNYLDNASQVPPPVYHPGLVADAVLHAATHPVREVTIGGSGMLMTWLTRLMPRLADRLFAPMYFRTAVSDDPPRRGGSGLHEPAGGGEELGDQSGHIRRVSFYTMHQISPWMKVGCIAAAAALTVGAVKCAPHVRAHLAERRRGPVKRLWQS